LLWDVLRGAAEEVLEVLKDDHSNDPDRKIGVERLMGATSSEKFAQFVAVGKLITDFAAGGGGGGEEGVPGDTLDDDIGVAVEFEEEDEEEEADNEVDEVLEASDVDDEDDDGQGGGEEAAEGRGVQGMDVDAGEEDVSDGAVKAADIDAYWLQREIAGAFGYTDAEASESRKLADDVLEALAAEGDDERACENRLVLLLDYDKFDLIKKLLKSRLRVVWCTRLARTQDDAEKTAVETEMASRPEAAAILDAMAQTGTRASARDRQNATESKIREEARRLRGEVATDVLDTGAGGAAAAGRKILELDALAFASGSHFMANKKCELPPGSYRSAKKGYEEVGSDRLTLHTSSTAL
jgi:pre-mRNA-splicing helicase BRR2